MNWNLMMIWVVTRVVGCVIHEEDEYDDVEIEFDLRDDDRFADYPDEYIELLSSFVEEAYKIECPHCLASLFDLFFRNSFRRLNYKAIILM